VEAERSNSRQLKELSELVVAMRSYDPIIRLQVLGSNAIGIQLYRGPMSALLQLSNLNQF
jgi:hypothetical protein